MNQERFKLSALDIIALLQKGQWAGKDLNAHERKIIVKYFYEEDSSWSNTAIAKLIAVTPQQVCKIKRWLKKVGVWEVEAINIEGIAIDLLKRKMEYQRKAVDGGDYALAWRIEVEFVEKMQDLGFVYKAPEKHLIGNMMLDAESKMLQYFKERGVPNVDEFIRQLSGSNGDGDDHDAVPVLALPPAGKDGTDIID